MFSSVSIRFRRFFSWIAAFCASIDERCVFQGVLSVWRRAPEHVGCVWCLRVLFRFHFGSKHSVENFCDDLYVLAGIILFGRDAAAFGLEGYNHAKDSGVFHVFLDIAILSK